MKNYYLCVRLRAPSGKKREVAIGHNCKAQLMPLFHSQLRNYLIIRVVCFLYRQVNSDD